MGKYNLVGGLGNVFKNNKKKLSLMQAVAAASAPVVGAALAIFAGRSAGAAQVIWIGSATPANNATNVPGSYHGGAFLFPATVSSSKVLRDFPLLTVSL